MREHLWLAVAMLLVGVGGPTEFGIGGRLDKAMEQDTKDMMEEICPAGMHREKVKRSCTDEPCPTDCVADKFED